ncbi:hypothetical protein CY0110_15982 [Crocosphaera chwakensis CCY0110]|uniref:Uncharacterized protein n=1 Tax=Crocosphaera chwakensis CCY0110 TaxID=391612 RepID=A3IHM8_9CHRO|nr:hypothetical protein CY0110_15982 [Crocosphaera chwakensis CCY0110]
MSHVVDLPFHGVNHFGLLGG